MTARRIIPCLDVDKGKVVKGIQFKDLREAGDPAELASIYDREGADEIVFLDISASVEARPILLDVVKRTADNVFIPLTVGGGVGDIKDFESLLLSGADKVAVNTAAVRNPELLEQAAKIFGSQCVVLAIDAKKVGDRYEVYTHGGRIGTGIDAIDWARRGEALGCGEILLTSIDRDGTALGYDIELTKLVADAVNIPVIASGGAGTEQHIVEVLTKANADAALIASLVHFGISSIKSIKQAVYAAGIEVRL
jgi:cyclase